MANGPSENEAAGAAPAKSGDKPRVLVTRRMPPNVTARLQREFDVTLNESDRVWTADERAANAVGHDAVLVCASDAMDAAAFATLADSVKIVATFSVGYEHVDMAAATASGIVVTNTPDVLTDATADITMLCLLGAARRGYEGQRMLREGAWVGWNTTLLLGTHVSAKRLGIFGMGRIGQAVARRARGFGMEVHYHNRRRLQPEQELGAVFHETPDQLLSVSQFLSINAPSSTETVGFLNATRIAQLPDGAVVVNTARGNVVDDDALIAALVSGKLAAAGLDVFNGEPALDARYRGVDNAYLLPHLGSATVETRDAMGFCCLDNFQAFFAGRPCPNALEA